MLEKTAIEKLLGDIGQSLLKNLYAEDEGFLKGMRALDTDAKELNKYRLWEWTQGIGLYGFFKLYQYTGDETYLGYLVRYYDERLAEGLPGKNVNTMAPMLTMALLHTVRPDERYLKEIEAWSDWVMKEMPRTKEGGFQHITSDSVNEGELWDDTLVMTVLFLAHAGKILNRPAYIDEAVRQYLLHTKYLTDRRTGLWYHGWTFLGNHNFAGALWGRGNSWITIGIPDFLDLLEGEGGVKAYLIETLARQIEALKTYQDESGMWHTLIDDPTSYLETSATAGFCYGILKSVRMGYVGDAYLDCALRAAEALTRNIAPDGTVLNVSYGTAMGRESLDFYRQIPIMPMPYGHSMVLLALIETLIHLEKNA